MRLFKKIALWGLGTAVGLLLLLVVLSFIVPLVVNTGPIKEKIATRINNAVAGQTRFRDLELHILPWPGVTLTQVRYDLPGRVNLAVDRIAVYPKLPTLLTGRLRIDRVRITSPAATVHLPVSPAATPGGGGLAFPDRSAVKAILARVPEDLSVRLEKGQISLVRDKQPVAQIHALSVRIENNDTLHAAVEGRSDVAEHFHLDAKVNTANADGVGQIDVTGARIARLENLLRPSRAPLVARAAVDLQVSIQSQKLQRVDIDFKSSAPAITLLRGPASVQGGRLLVQGSAKIAPGRLHVDVNQLKLAQPRLNMNASLSWSQQDDQETAPPLQLRLHANDSDITAMRDALMRLAGSKAEAATLLQVIRGGTLVSMTLNAAGDSPAALARTQNLRISGAAADAHLFIPDVRLDLTDVSGKWQFADGVLSAQDARGRIGDTRAKNGLLKLGLRKGAEFIGLDVDLAADLAQLPPVLNRLTSRPDVQAELARLHSIRGSADGHLALSGPFRSVAVHVSAADFTFTADYNRLPDPLQMQGSGLDFTLEGIALKTGDLRMGRSTIHGLGGRLTWKKAPRLDIRSDTALLDWDQLYPWLVRTADIRKKFKLIQNIGGRLSLRNTRLAGPLHDVRQWQYAAAGTPTGLTIHSPRLPAPLTVTQGSFDLVPARISFDNIRFSLLDSRIEAQGTIDGYRTPRPRMALSAAGEVGDRAAMWLQQALNVPDALYVRAPVHIKDMDLSWQPQAPTRVQGTFNFPGDLNLGCDLTSSPDGFDLQRLTLADSFSNVQMSLRHNPSQRLWASTYSGHLQNETLAKLLRKDTVYVERIEGDFSAHVRMDHLAQTRLQGQLKGRNLILSSLPWGPIFVRRFDLTGRRNDLQIDRLSFSLDEQQASLHGKAAFTDQGIALNASLGADTIDLDRVVPKFTSSAGRSSSRAQKRDAALPEWTARIDIAVDQLNYGSYTLQPLRGALALKRGRVEMKLAEAGLCGISLQGNLTYAQQKLSLVAIPQASGRTIQFAAGCLSGARATERIEGTYDINGRLTSQGTTVDALLRNLQGAVKMTALNGRVFNLGKVGLFSNLLSYLEINNLVGGKLPNLSEKGFQYKKIESEVAFGEGKAELKEARVISGGLNMVAGGDVNLLERQMDLTVLVSPLTTLDAIIRHLPVVGRILKGTLVAIPVGVSGPVTDPKVVPLSPKAVGSRLLGIMERTLETPFKLVEPILPKSQEKEQTPNP